MMKVAPIKDNEISDIKYAYLRIISVPWMGAPCIVQVRELTDLQIQTIGNFSLIELNDYKWSKSIKNKKSYSEALSYAEMNSKICMASLVSPTYEEIFDLVGQHEFNKKVEDRIKNINGILDEMKIGPARNELEEIRDSLILAWITLLPNDFMTEVVKYALGINRTDIKKVTEEILLNSAILAKRCKKAPHEYIGGGIFSDFNLRDIDETAWKVYDKAVEDAKKDRDK